MSDELLNCPFCGGAADIHEDIKPGSETRWIYAACGICDARGPELAGSSIQYAGRNKGEAGAIAAWNTRHVSSTQGDGSTPIPDPSPAQVEALVEALKAAIRETEDFYPHDVPWVEAARTALSAFMEGRAVRSKTEGEG